MSNEILTSNCSELAEGPLWHPDHQKVYWVDIESGTLYAFDPETNEAQIQHCGSKIGGFTIQEDGALLLFREKGAIELFDGSVVRPIIPELPDELESRFNDVSADPAGRVFCGTMPSPTHLGRLYRLDPDGSIRAVIEEVGCSNGLGWSLDRHTMYFTDSADKTIYALDYDEATGEISNRRPFFVLRTDGVPDGMTVDADGNVWTAIWDGGCVIQVDPKGEEMRRIALPAQQITSPTFGGKNFDVLYVTAAGGHLEDQGQGAGELMRVHPGVRGLPEFRSRIQVLE